MPITYDGRNIQFVEIKHEHKESSVRVYIADNFLTERECDGLTAAHLSHVREASKKQPLVCFEGVQTMNKYLKDINFRYTGSKSDFTPGTLCVNESFSKSLSKRLHYSLSTAFYRGDSKFSEIFEEQVEKATGLSKVHGGKFQITSYNANVGECSLFFSITIRNLTKSTNLQHIQSTMPPKARKDTLSSSLHFEWHLQFFNHEKVEFQTSLAPNNAKQVLFLLLEIHSG